MSQSRFAALLVLSVSLLTAVPARAGVIATRGDVQALLGAQAQLEDFEKFHASPFTAYALDHTTLDSHSIEHGRGPGLVNPGLTFSVNPGSGMQWSGTNILTNPSAALTFNIGRLAPGKVDFATPTSAFGVDLIGVRASNVTPVVPFTLNVYAPDDVTLLATFSVSTNANTPAFIGFGDVGGIGSFTLTREGSAPQFPSLDNLIYTNAFTPPSAPTAAAPLPAAVLAGAAPAPLCAMFRRAWRR
jgi:hypothetical protein